MPEYLRALIVVLLLATTVFAFARRPAGAVMADADFMRRRNLWFGLTLLAFLAHSFWIYALITALLLLNSASREGNRVALFFFLIFLIPATGTEIPGFGLINFLFEISHVRLLELVILLPAFLVLRGRSDTLPFGRTGPDKVLAVYLLFLALLQLREASPTGAMRDAFYLFTDVFLPYFVISRSLKSLQDFREAMLALLLAAMALAAIFMFETVWHWHLYRGMASALGVSMDTLSYIERSNLLRAMGPTGHPIVAGYVMTVVIGFYLFLQAKLPGGLSRRLAMALLFAGLVAPLSRGPWLGAMALLIVFVATGGNAIKRLFLLGLSGAMILALLSVLPGGGKVIDLLPFIGSVETGGIDYRKQLIDNTYEVILRYPVFGSVNFALEPEMQAMIQGQGIIDVVNTYLLLALQTGMVGLGLFAGFFALVAWGIFKGFRRLPDREGEEHLLGRALLATLVGALLIITTVSPIGLIPLIYWSVAGMGVAYAQMLRVREAGA